MNKKLNVYFATMMGTAEGLASSLVEAATDQGLNVELCDFSEESVETLKEVEYAVFIASTWGDGDPPEDCEDLWEKLQNTTEDFSNMKYSVFGLGDTSYSEFNAFARLLDQRLFELDATRILPRVEADVDYEDDFEEWQLKLLEFVKSVFNAREVAATN